MTTLSPINSTAQTALRLFQLAKPVPTISGAGNSVPKSRKLLDFTGNLFSPKTSEALTRIAELTSEDPSNVDPSRVAPTEARKVTKGDYTYFESAVMTREELPAAIRDRVAPAAGYTLVTTEDVSDEEHHATVLAGLKELHAETESFQKALREGTLVIQRPEDVEGLTGWESYTVKYYNSDGYASGIAGFGGDETTSALVRGRKAAGYGQASGVIQDLNFYAYWPGKDMEV